jgi:hypothetical protein
MLVIGFMNSTTDYTLSALIILTLAEYLGVKSWRLLSARLKRKTDELVAISITKWRGLWRGRLRGHALDNQPLDEQMMDKVNHGQEWTAKLASHGWYIECDAMHGMCIDNELTAKAIVNAHNAAIAAEREKTKKLQETLRLNALAQMESGKEEDALREQLDAAVEALRRARKMTYDLGGNMATIEMLDAVLVKIGEKIP